MSPQFICYVAVCHDNWKLKPLIFLSLNMVHLSLPICVSQQLGALYLTLCNDFNITTLCLELHTNWLSETSSSPWWSQTPGVRLTPGPNFICMSGTQSHLRCWVLGKKSLLLTEEQLLSSGMFGFLASHDCDPRSSPCLDMTFLKDAVCRS